MMNDEQDKPLNQLTSVEAAALYLSEGQTIDPQKAVIYDNNRKNELDMDALQRAHLRRMLGFDFTIQLMPNVILVTDKHDASTRVRCKVNKGDLIETPDGPKLATEAVVHRLVAACMQLKRKYEASQRNVR